MANAYQYLINKIQKKIEGWQAKYLSVASHVTLIKSTVASILNYAMQTTLLLQKVSRKLDKINCQFLWGDTNHHRSYHTISWETITNPKEARGLGIKTVRHMNMATLMNQAWRFQW